MYTIFYTIIYVLLCIINLILKNTLRYYVTKHKIMRVCCACIDNIAYVYTNYRHLHLEFSNTLGKGIPTSDLYFPSIIPSIVIGGEGEGEVLMKYYSAQPGHFQPSS